MKLRTFLAEKGENWQIIRQSIYVEYIGHKNMSLLSLCLGFFKQLVFSNVRPKAKYLFISGTLKTLKGYLQRLSAIVVAFIRSKPHPIIGKVYYTRFLHTWCATTPLNSLGQNFLNPNSCCHLGTTIVRSARSPTHLKHFEDKEFTEDFKSFFIVI